MFREILIKIILSPTFASSGQAKSIKNCFHKTLENSALLIHVFSEGLGKNFFLIFQNSLSILSQRIFFTAPFKLFGRVFPSHSWECYGAFIIIAQLVNKHKYFWFVMFYSCLLTKMSFYQKKFEVKKCCLAFFYLCLHCRYNSLIQTLRIQCFV